MKMQLQPIYPSELLFKKANTTNEKALLFMNCLQASYLKVSKNELLSAPFLLCYLPPQHLTARKD